MSAHRSRVVADQVGRSCGDCDLCCTVHGVTGVTETGERCKNLRSGTVTLLDMHMETSHHPQSGCAIYANRPKMCREWFCAWRLGLGTDDDRPDRAGFIPDFVASNYVRFCFDTARLETEEGGAIVDRAQDLAERIREGTAGKDWRPMQVVPFLLQKMNSLDEEGISGALCSYNHDEKKEEDNGKDNEGH